MLFTRKALGLEICQDGVKMALVGGTRDKLSLDAHGSAGFPADTLKFSIRDPNIHNASAFVAGVKETYLRLLTKVERVSVSLPDSIGRVMLVELETRFKNKEEGANIIRWKLKKNFPFDVNEAHLDYQVLLEKESGEITALVALISRNVLHQYEDLLCEAGLQPNHIDFTTFNLYSLFANRLELAENAAVLVCYQEMIGVLIFSAGLLTFYRTKEIPGGMADANRVFREINSSLLVYNDKYPLSTISEVFFIASLLDAESFSSVVAEAMGQEPILLDVSRIVEAGEKDSMNKMDLFSFGAALGAAIRNL